MTQYELLYIVSAQLTEDEVAPVKEKIKKIIESADGKILKQEDFGKKKLAYPIKKFHQGYYLFYEFEIDGAKIPNLNTTLKLTDDIIRHIIVKSYLKEVKPKVPVLKKKPETEAPAQEKSEESTKIKKDDEKEKIKLEDLDKKLDEILDTDNLL